MELTLKPWNGYVTVEARDAATGELIDRIVSHNAYCNAAAVDYAAALGGSAISLAVSHIDVGFGGGIISLCESTSGWTGSPVLDSSIYREGAGALKGSASASGSAVYYHATSSGGTVNIGSGGTALFSVRLTSRSATDLSGSRLRLYTSASDWRYISLTDAETATGLTLADTTWTNLAIPASAAGWATGAGTPGWGTVTGVGVTVKASGASTAVVHWDQVVGLPALGTAGTTIATFTATPGSRGQKAVGDLTVSGGTVVSSSTWTSTEVVGDIRWAGIYARSGVTLLACAPLTFYKAAGVVMTVRWTAVVAGG